MDLVVEVGTKISDLVIEFIEVIDKKGRVIPLNWDYSYAEGTKDGFVAKYMGVCFGEESAMGRLDELIDCRIDNIGLYSESGKKLDIHIKKMTFSGEGQEWEYDGTFATQDNDETNRYRKEVKKWIDSQLREDDFKALKEFAEGDYDDDSILYDIAYNQKSDMEKSAFNPFNEQEKSVKYYGAMYDEWYDAFIEDVIIPYLRQVARKKLEVQ